MSTDVEIEQALTAVAATMNDQKLETLEAQRVQKLVNDALGGEPTMTVDDGGGIHDDTGARVGAIRRTDSGEWIIERQRPTTDRSDAAVPTEPPRPKLRKLLTQLKIRG
jgi:hypothetical protein